MTITPPPTSCPCGTGTSYDDCCGRLHRQQALATTAEELMRSRYAAYALGEVDHVFRTWHPRTRPAVVTDQGLEWTELEVLATEDGGPEDEHGIVEFRAHHRDDRGEHVLHERSTFRRRAGRWMYVDDTG